MKKWVSRLLWVILAIVVLAGSGFLGYRLGYRNALQANGNLPGDFFHHFRDHHKLTGQEMHQMHPGFDVRPMRPAFGQDQIRITNRGYGYGSFTPFGFIFKLAFLGIVVWIFYNLFKGNGWQLSLTRNMENKNDTGKPSRKKSA